MVDVNHSVFIKPRRSHESVLPCGGAELSPSRHVLAGRQPTCISGLSGFTFLWEKGSHSGPLHLAAARRGQWKRLWVVHSGRWRHN